MRKLIARLDGNPLLQVLVLGGMATLVAVLLYVRVASGPKSGAPPADAGATAPTATAPTATASVAPNAGPVPAPTTGSASPASSAPSAPTTAVGGELSKPGPGVPAGVARAYSQDRAIVLLVNQRNGVPEQVSTQAAGILSRRPDLAVFSFDVSRISDYARITQGVDVSRAPAIIVVPPASQSHGAPQATVRYGYMGPESVLGIVADALYTGPTIPSYPQ